jgi:hypothetical protein
MEILRSIEKNIIDITNANNDIDADMLKKNIKSYFEKIADKENVNNMKRDKYYEDYENKRVEQHINYDNYLREKAELMETFKNNKTKTALYNYLKLKPPKYDNLTLYSYLDVKIAEEKPVVVKDDKPIVKEEKPTAKEEKSVAKQLDKCTPAKKAECEKKGKKCNPDSGRCVKADKPAAKEEDKPTAKEEDKPAAKEEDKPETKVDKCTPSKIDECEKKGKKCNPDSGRCIKK